MASQLESGVGATPIRVAVLGGGAAALAAAYVLSERGGYEITVYEMGWRLGGKGASGRRLSDGRDLEHGLHVLGGFYHNAMGLLWRAYEAWPHASEHALRFDEVFLRHSRVHIMENDPAGRYPVRFPFPENDRPLGREPRDLDLRTIAQQLLKYIEHQTRPDRPRPRGAEYAHDDAFRTPLQAALAEAAPEILGGRAPRTARLVPELSALKAALAIAQAPRAAPTPPPVAHEPDYGIIFEIGLVVALGILAEGLWWKGFDAANDEEFSAWMIRHGLSDRARASSYFRCGYDYAFAFLDGDPSRPMMAAGSGLRGFLRMVLTYNGSVFVHMKGGMGEIVFVPLFEVLVSRGVRFQFFHRIDAIELDDDGVRLRRICGTMQNEPKDGAPYDPLVLYQPPDPELVRWVWPDAPIADRLRHPVGEALRPEFLYETPWQKPSTATPFELWPDEDFDLCILGIPVGALPVVAADLAAKIPEWDNMLKWSGTSPTLSAQLWQPQNTADLGWPNGQTTLTANMMPHSTWADMSFLLGLEAKSDSRHLSYFCGPVPTAYYQVSPYDTDYGPPELNRGDVETRRWCNNRLAEFLPNARVPQTSQPGAADELYVKLNSFPSDLYVLTKPGGVDHRLTPGGSFVPNLYLAGDWTRNGYDIGSFETAVLSGLLCAQAIAGGPMPATGGQDRGA